jgi:hypothetical protein
MGAKFWDGRKKMSRNMRPNLASGIYHAQNEQNVVSPVSCRRKEYHGIYLL